MPTGAEPTRTILTHANLLGGLLCHELVSWPAAKRSYSPNEPSRHLVPHPSLSFLCFLSVALGLVLRISTQAGPLNLSPFLGKAMAFTVVSHCADGFVFSLTLQTHAYSISPYHPDWLRPGLCRDLLPTSSFPLCV